MKKRIFSVVIAFALALCAFPLSAFADAPEKASNNEPEIVEARHGETITMCHTDVVVRSAPGTNNSKVGTLYVGQRVTVINWAYEKVGKYYWVQILWPTGPDGYGYVREDLIP